MNIPPEAYTFDQDRALIAPTASAYLRNIPSSIGNALRVFNRTLSKIDSITAESIARLTDLPRWTYTPTQSTEAADRLARIAALYPIPPELKTIAPGRILDISNDPAFHPAVDSFLGKLPDPPAPVRLGLDSMGRIPLAEITDPQISLAALWTPDVSYNPGLSIKDIMARQMIDDALSAGRLTGSTTIVEGTSGNTGAGLAIVAAAHGLRLVLITPSKVSREKIARLTAMGSHVIITPSAVDPQDPRSYYSIRDYIAGKRGFWTPMQYDNHSNRNAHETVTGPLIWEQTDGEVTAVIVPAGTCGTVSGIGRFLKRKSPRIKIIAVDTVGSILYLLKQGFSIDEVQKFAISYTIQGFGEDIHPKNLDLSVIDRFVRVSDASGLHLTRALPALGFVQGQSSGASYAAILETIADGYITARDRVVVVFPDTGIPYRHDVFDESWMQSTGFSVIY